MSDADVLSDMIIEQMADALICIDARGQVVRWNLAASNMFGYSASEMLGGSLDPIIPEHLRAAHWAGFNAAMSSGCTKLQGHPTLTRAVHKNGHKLYVEMTFALVKEKNGPAMGSVAVARDVTEKVERERAARARATSGKVEPAS